MSNSILWHSEPGGLVRLVLNRPDRLNALDADLIDRLMAALDDIERDAGITAVILTGTGDRAFSAGADIPELAERVAGGVEVALRD
ncbi:enoyl-CoA hydratase/isomerase family protein, partial [Pseudomonas aeruginosa]|uniref:enoyl-CoA hydratase/isomerase family protein n=1 Tax=Pseudomonas aeruginosa TaxID=287 RepID=UPI002F95560E